MFLVLIQIIGGKIIALRLPSNSYFLILDLEHLK